MWSPYIFIISKQMQLSLKSCLANFGNPPFLIPHIIKTSLQFFLKCFHFHFPPFLHFHFHFEMNAVIVLSQYVLRCSGFQSLPLLADLFCPFCWYLPNPIIEVIIIIIIILTRPWPAYGRHGLAGSSGSDQSHYITVWCALSFGTNSLAPT